MRPASRALDALSICSTHADVKLGLGVAAYFILSLASSSSLLSGIVYSTMKLAKIYALLMDVGDIVYKIRRALLSILPFNPTYQVDVKLSSMTDLSRR